MGFLSRDDLNLSAIKTEEMSSEIPYLKNIMQGDAESLISRLNVANKNLVLFSDSENYDMYNMFQQSNGISHDNFSETSPFISSDIYNHLTHNQQMRGGADESSSSTSSSTQTDGSSDKKKKKHEKKHDKKDNDKKEESSSEESEEFMGRGGDSESQSTAVTESSNSYISSSAHTDGVDSASPSEATTVSVSRKHRGRRYHSESVNTSDINIISVDE